MNSIQSVVRAQSGLIVFKLLMSVRQVGRMKANTLLKRAVVLTRRQCTNFASTFRREGRR